MDWSPLFLTFQLAMFTTVLLLVISLPLAYYLAYSDTPLKPVWQSIIAMPLILPPTVLGFYLLVVLSPERTVGRFLENMFDLQLVFSFPGLVVGSMIYSLPFMVHPILSGFLHLDPKLKECAAVMGKSKWDTLRYVLLPNIKPSILTGLILAFAHTIGEFGVILMIGGNIPGSTRVASIAIYEEVESMNYSLAHKYSLILFVICFLILLLTFLINNKSQYADIRK